MTEADILAQLQTGRYNISVIASQLLGLVFAMIVATYYFLHKAGLIVRLIAFGLFTAGYAALLVLFAWENLHMDGLEFELARLATDPDASRVVIYLSEGWNIGRTAVPDALTGFVIASGWLSIAFLMFFYNFETQTRSTGFKLKQKKMNSKSVNEEE